MDPLTLAPWLLLALVLLVAVAIGSGWRAMGLVAQPKRWRWLLTLVTDKEQENGLPYGDGLWIVTFTGVELSKAEASGQIAGHLQSHPTAAVHAQGMWSEA